MKSAILVQARIFGRLLGLWLLWGRLGGKDALGGIFEADAVNAEVFGFCHAKVDLKLFLMNETEKQVAEKILKRINETLNSEQILNYLQFMQSVKIRLEISKLNSSS